jgi:cytochrome P450
MDDPMTARNETSQCPVSLVRVDDFDLLQKVLRSGAVEQNAHVVAHNYVCPSELGDINVAEFLDGNVAMINGEAHKERRRVLNALVRPHQLERYREEIILPSIDRWMSRLVKQDEAGRCTCDVAQLVELVFLEFAAKLIGLEGVESEEGMARLRGCALPIFGGLSASHFENRREITQAGVAAKQVLVEEFYRPSLDHVRRQVARVEAGEIADEDVPLSLLKMIVTGSNPDYRDEDVAVREVILFFVATTGTSVQGVLSTIDYLSQWFETYPDDRAKIEDMEFISRALQEALRLRAPFIPYVTRFAREDVEVDDLKIEAGDEIHAWLARAGHDPAIFGADANAFNPMREVPPRIPRYGLAFAMGAHQCLGLRAVLGSDGKSGSHMRIVQKLFRAGIRQNPDIPPRVLALKHDEDQPDDIPTYITYPVILDNWSAKA